MSDQNKIGWFIPTLPSYYQIEPSSVRVIHAFDCTECGATEHVECLGVVAQTVHPSLGWEWISGHGWICPKHEAIIEIRDKVQP